LRTNFQVGDRVRHTLPQFVGIFRADRAAQFSRGIIFNAAHFSRGTLGA
jgi:hypothetical protein